MENTSRNIGFEKTTLFIVTFFKQSQFPEYWKFRYRTLQTTLFQKIRKIIRLIQEATIGYSLKFFVFARDVNDMISVHTNMFVFEALTMLGTYARRSYRSTSGRDSWRTSRQHYFAKFPRVYGANFSAIPFWFSLKSTVPWIYLFRINMWKLKLIYSNRSLEKIAWFNWNGQMDAVGVVSFRFQIVHLSLSVI